MVGDHLVTPRFGYMHHGIEAPDGTVVEFNKYKRVIQRVSRGEFAARRSVSVVSHAWSFPRHVIATRALGELGKRDYHLLRNNCEHFANWCVEGEATSPQVAAGLVVAAVLGLVALIFG